MKEFMNFITQRFKAMAHKLSEDTTNGLRVYIEFIDCVVHEYMYLF